MVLDSSTVTQCLLLDSPVQNKWAFEWQEWKHSDWFDPSCVGGQTGNITHLDSGL